MQQHGARWGGIGHVECGMVGRPKWDTAMVGEAESVWAGYDEARE